MIEEQEFFIKYLHEFTYNEMSYLFLEFYEEEDIQMDYALYQAAMVYTLMDDIA